MLYWLLSAEALQLRTLRAIREARTPLGAELRIERAERETPLTYDGRTAVIRVEGVLTPTPDVMAECYGEPNTTYGELREALASALNDKSVKDIRWEIDSPGGAVDGLFPLLEDMRDARAEKKMSALVYNAHSAAYGIAAATGGEVIAASRSSSVGSVGVATSGFVSGGICGKVVEMTSSNAPEKRPDIETPEGRAVVVAYLDQIEEQFFDAIASGRGVSRAAVASGYGRGASFLAPKAETMGLIDKVAKRKRSAYAPNLTDARTPDSVRDRMAQESDTEARDVTPEPAPAPASAELAIPVEVDASAIALAAAERAELEQLRAERAQREAAELRGLVTELVSLGAETPATAFANGAPVPRLASEGLPALRARVAALRGARPAPVQPPASTIGEEALEDFERADAAKIKDPDARARFVERRLARKQKAMNHG